MSLKRTVGSLDEVPDHLKEYYHQLAPGVFRLGLDEDGPITNLEDRLRRDLDRRTTERDQAVGRLEDYELRERLLHQAREEGLAIDRSAGDYLLHSAKSAGWKADGNKLTAFSPSGSLVYGHNGETPLRYRDWLKNHLKVQMPRIFLDRADNEASAQPDGSTATREASRSVKPSRSRMSVKERSAFVAEHGRAKYLSLPE